MTVWPDGFAIGCSFVAGQYTHCSHRIGGTGLVAVKFITETSGAPAYDTVVPASRGWSPTVALRGYFE